MGNQNAGSIERVLESFERLTADISSRFSYIPIDELPGAIESALRELVVTLDVDRSTVFELLENRDTLKMLHFWARPGVAAVRVGDMAGLTWYIGRLREGEAVSFGDLEGNLPPEADFERAYVRAVGMKSNLTVPAFIGGRLVCALAVGSFREAREWPDPLVERVRLIAQIIAAALLRRSQELALRASLDEIERLNRQLRAENVYLHEELKSRHHFDEIVGNSEALNLVLARVEQVAPTQSTVLLLGESGTGKALFAHAIHERSPRRQRPFVEVNCAALPPGLIESELFGHEKGAFTGAVAQRLGRFEIADGGTLFLDEVADLPLELQGRLLRVLQEGEFERVGSSRTRRVDVRVVAATNQDLEAAVRAGRFRVRSVLPSERLSDRAAAASRPDGGHPAAVVVLRHAPPAPDGASHRAGAARRDGRLAALPLARQRARTSERRRARDDPLDWRRPRNRRVLRQRTPVAEGPGNRSHVGCGGARAHHGSAR